LALASFCVNLQFVKIGWDSSIPTAPPLPFTALLDKNETPGKKMVGKDAKGSAMLRTGESGITLSKEYWPVCSICIILCELKVEDNWAGADNVQGRASAQVAVRDCEVLNGNQ